MLLVNDIIRDIKKKCYEQLHYARNNNNGTDIRVENKIAEYPKIFSR